MTLQSHVEDSASRPSSPMEMLKRVDRTLAVEVAAVLGVRPTLDLVAQVRSRPPHPAWAAPPLPTDEDALTRWTAYRVGRLELTRNVAYVDPRSIAPGLLEALEMGRTSLGEVFEDPEIEPEIEKFAFEFGTDEMAARLDPALFDTIARGGSHHRPYVWRRYSAALRGMTAFVVIEVLPVETWDRILGSDEGELARLTGASG